MASANIAFPQSRMPAPMQVRGMARSLPVHFMARLAFGVLFVFSLTNAIGLYITYVRNARDESYTLSVYPVLFAVCATIVFAFSKPRKRSTILLAGWAFWLVFFLGGFLGPQQITAGKIVAFLRLTIMPWISIVGLPWLALRAVSEDKVAKFLRATVLVAAAGRVWVFCNWSCQDFCKN